MLIKLAAAVAVVFASVSVYAAEYTIDPAHSTIGFSIKHMVSKVRGQFDKFEGIFSYDEKKPEDFKLNVTIQTKSVNTSNEKRDNHLRSADFFDADKFPTITYVGKKVEKTSKDHYKIAGDLTMHGVTKPIELAAEVTGDTTDPQGNHRGGMEVKGVVPRKEFGIVWNKTLDKGGLMLGDDVDFSFNIEATENKPGAAKKVIKENKDEGTKSKAKSK